MHLDTIGWKSGKRHHIEIWFVQYNERFYVISELRNSAHWVQNIVRDPRVSFSVNDMTFTGVARIIDQEKEFELIAEVSKLMSTKYGWSEGLTVELTLS